MRGSCLLGKINMAIIPEFFALRARKKIAWLGDTLPKDGAMAFSERGFIVETCTDTDLQDASYLAGLAAVVFTQNPVKPRQIVTHLKTHAVHLLDHDCRIILRPASLESPPGSKHIIHFIHFITDTINMLRLPTASLPAPEAEKLKDWRPTGGGIPPLPHAHVFEEIVPWGQIANLIMEHPPGKAPDGNLKIFIGSKEINASSTEMSCSQQLLLRRAFWDCREVHLVRENEGQSCGVTVYRAYADLRAQGAITGSWPLPYFVKIGDRNRIFKEHENYRKYVDPYVPFHLGPHLIYDRCCLGAHDGVIVGDYVEESESLRDCANDGRAASAIASLFNRTLHGWYRDAKESEIPLTKSLKFPRFQPNKTKLRIEHAQKLGSRMTPKELFQLFRKSAAALPVLEGPTHGDLHAKNVRVRATDAIVIDFLAYDKKPLIYDAALLEASLLVDGFIVDERDVAEWLESLKPLYDYKELLNAPAHPHPKDSSSWFYACVRQIRLYARQMQRHDGQYAAALAVALLKKASKDLDAAEPEASRRAAAYVLAENILMNAFNSAT
jgi:hypothetical protein